MAIDTISPVADSQLDPGDSFSFRIDDTYTTITIEVETAGGWEYAYDSSLSGAQAGYTVTVVDLGSRHEFTVTRTAGWNLSPFSIRVVENETGSEATTTTNYTLYSATDFPQTSDPYFLQSLGDSFLAHYDTPSSYAGQGGKAVLVKGTEDGLEFALGGSTDANAIHDNVANEISALTEKVTPADDDIVIIEDSAAGFVKKKVKKSALGGAGAWDDLTGTANDVPMNTAPTGLSTAEGTVFWDADDHCLAFKPDVSTATMQIGQENWVRVYNDSGSLIANGSIVYISGAEGVEGRPTVALAQADDSATSKVLGAVTADIANGAFGYVTQFGLVRDVNTASFAAGTPMFLSETTPGGYTDVEPKTPNFSVFLGYVIVQDAVNGVGFMTTLGNTGGGLAGAADLLTVPARKGSAGTITAGQAVYISGYNVGQAVLEVELADADGTGTMPALGLAANTITNSANGDVVVSGILPNINTGSWSVGDALYVSDTAGALTNVRPSDGSLVQKVGTVARSNASNGSVHVTGAGRSNDITNSIYLPEQADHLQTPAAGWGELWLNNATKQDLIFTDDGGSDRNVLTLRTATKLGNNAIPVGYGTEGTCDFSTLFSWTGSTLTLGQTAGSNIKFLEAASIAATPGANYGAIWVRNDTPNIPVFTDDAGTNMPIVRVNDSDAWTNTALIRANTGDGQVSSVADLRYDSVNDKLLLNAAGASIRIAETGTPPSSTAGYTHIFCENDAPSVLSTVDDAGTKRYAIDRQRHYLRMTFRGGSATGSTYFRQTGRTPDTYQSWGTSAGTTQGSPTAMANTMSAAVVPFNGKILGYTGYLRYFTTTDVDIELWRNYVASPGDASMTQAELLATGGFINCNGTNFASGSGYYSISNTYSSNNSVSAGDALEILLYNNTGVSGYPVGTVIFEIMED